MTQTTSRTIPVISFEQMIDLWTRPARIIARQQAQMLRLASVPFDICRDIWAGAPMQASAPSVKAAIAPTTSAKVAEAKAPAATAPVAKGTAVNTVAAETAVAMVEAATATTPAAPVAKTLAARSGAPLAVNPAAPKPAKSDYRSGVAAPFIGAQAAPFQPAAPIKPQTLPFTPVQPAALAAPKGTADDLKQIKGLGPKLERLVKGMGYHHFDQIAAWSPAEVAWMDENLEGFKGRVSRDKWVKQAKALAAAAKAG